MLGKLMKYEWKSTWKLLAPANLLIVVMTFFACVTLRLDLSRDISNNGAVFSAVVIMLMYVLSMFVALVGTAIYLIYRFYSSTYGDQGYLLHTLPVDKHRIIMAKVFVSFGWVLISLFLMYTSIFFIMDLEREIISTLVEMLQIAIIGTYQGKLAAITVIMTIITMVVEMFARILKVTACISLGQLSSNHKLLVAFAYYFGIYIVQQIVSTFLYIMLGFIQGRMEVVQFGGSWEIRLIIDLIYCVVFYLLTWHVMDKKLNLD